MANDYIFAYQLAINRYYVDAEHEYLLSNFDKISYFAMNNTVVKMNMELVTFE